MFNVWKKTRNAKEEKKQEEEEEENGTKRGIGVTLRNKQSIVNAGTMDGCTYVRSNDEKQQTPIRTWMFPNPICIHVYISN